MVRHVLLSNCTEGVDRADCKVRFLREIARFQHLSEEGRDDEWAHDDLISLVQRVSALFLGSSGRYGASPPTP